MSLLERVRVAAARLDDDALAALASRGLVRRARKDLEARPPLLEGEADGKIALAVDGARVLIDERPQASVCSCPAAGVCRHVLAALMFLAAGAAPVPQAAAGDELARLALDEIERWAGAALLRRARRELTAGLRVDASDGPTLVLALPDWGLSCRYVAGAGLAGMLCACHEPSPCIHRVAGALGHRLGRGVDPPLAAAEALAASEQAPRTRDEVRQGVQALCEELVTAGLGRVSPSAVQRLRTLATSAHGVDLPRLERVVRALGDEIERWLGRGPTASDEEVLARACLADALARALVRPTPALVGQHRSRYERAHTLELVGAGARAFRSASGYHGLTVHFWDRGAQVWTSWSDVRPEGVPGFDPIARLTAPGPWRGCASPVVAAASHLQLQGAWRSRARRLSGRESTAMVALGPTTAALLPPPLTRWSHLVEQARRCLVLGLAEVEEGAGLALVQPAQWGSPAFDPVDQTLVRMVHDDQGWGLPLVIPQGRETAAALGDLENLRPAPGASLFGMLRLYRGELALAPISVVDGGGVHSLGLTMAAPARSAGDSGPDDGQEADDPQASDTAEGPIAAALDAAWAELEALAALGVGAYRRWAILAEREAAIRGIGLEAAAAALQALSMSAGTARVAGAVLHAAWVMRLTGSALAVEQAAGRLG